MDGMDSIELRAKLGDRTYEAGVRLLEKDAIIERIELSGTAGYAKVRDSGTMVVVYRDRNGVFDATCDCTVKPMGCKHCAAVYMDRIGFRPDASADAVRGHIAGFAETSFDPYDYDIVGHFGYVTRYAPYPDKSLMQPQFAERVDKILGRIIALGKTLEVNTHIRAPFPQLPEDAVLRRYFELGGRNITFSSDAHRLTDLGDKFEDTREKLAAMGFAHWTVYVRRKPVRIPLFADAAEITAAIDAART